MDIATLIIGALALVAIVVFALRKRSKRKPATTVQHIGSHWLDADTADGRITLQLPKPAGINPAQALLRFECRLKLDNYLAQNPTGHFAIVLRADLASIARAVFGHGAIGGSIFGRPPVWYLETWFNGATLPGGRRSNIVFADKRSSEGSLRDGVNYRLMIESTIRANQRYLRMVVQGDDGSYHDTGQIADPNMLFDANSTAIAFGHVFASKGKRGWAIQINDAAVTWRAL